MNPPEELMAMAGGHGLGPWPEAMALGLGLGQKVVAAISSFNAAPPEIRLN